MRKLIVCGILLLCGVALASPKLNLKGNNNVVLVPHLDLSGKTVLVLEGVVEMWKMKDLAEHLSDDSIIHLVINSPGGSVGAGVHFINKVEILRNQKKLKQLHCYIQDMAASMAAIIAAYCDQVSIHKFGWYMIHEASFSAQGSESEIRRQVAWVQGYLDQLFSDMAGALGVTPAQLKAFQGPERFLIAKETVRHGLADMVFGTLYHEGYTPEEPQRGLGFIFRELGFFIDYRTEDTDRAKN